MGLGLASLGGHAFVLHLLLARPLIRETGRLPAGSPNQRLTPLAKQPNCRQSAAAQQARPADQPGGRCVQGGRHGDMLVLCASRSGKVCTRMGTEHHVHVVSRRGGIPAFRLGIHKQASHLLGEASLAAKDSHQLNQLLTPLPTDACFFLCLCSHAEGLIQGH